MKKYIYSETGTGATITLPVGVTPDQVIVTNVTARTKLVYNRLDTVNPNGIAIAADGTATKAASAAAGLSITSGEKDGSVSSSSINGGRGTLIEQAVGDADAVVIGASAAVNVSTNVLLVEVVEADA